MRFHLNIADLITLSWAEESWHPWSFKCFWERGAPLQREKPVSNPNLSMVHLMSNIPHISMAARCLQTCIGAFYLKKGYEGDDPRRRLITFAMLVGVVCF